MLEVIDLECIRGEKRLFEHVGFQLKAGELLYLQGKNGSGKTSLLRMLVGLTQPVHGEIRWCGEAIRRLDDEYRAVVCYLGHQNAIKEELTPLENLRISTALALPAASAGSPGSKAEALSEDKALAALEQLGLLSRADLPCKFLSQGQKRRVALARLVNETRTLWVLDEAFVALDTAAVEFVAGLIAAHLERGGLAVMTTHQVVKIPVPAAQIREFTLAGNP